MELKPLDSRALESFHSFGDPIIKDNNKMQSNKRSNAAAGRHDHRSRRMCNLEGEEESLTTLNSKLATVRPIGIHRNQLQKGK